MANTNPLPGVVADSEELKRQWLAHLTTLVDTVEGWARELGWSTRRIEKNMKDSELGRYQAPALLLQEEFTRGLLDPIYHYSPGTEGAVDLYLMPAYDDVARLFFSDGKWSVYRMPPGVPAVGTYEEAGPGTLSKETFREVLEGMKEYDAR
jgi:hypothetical protein